MMYLSTWLSISFSQFSVKGVWYFLEFLNFGAIIFCFICSKGALKKGWFHIFLCGSWMWVTIGSLSILWHEECQCSLLLRPQCSAECMSHSRNPFHICWMDSLFALFIYISHLLLYLSILHLHSVWYPAQYSCRINNYWTTRGIGG